MGLECDFTKVGETFFKIGDRDFSVEVVDSVQDYSDLMKQIFDFEALKEYFSSGVKVTVDALNGGNTFKSHILFDYFNLN